MEDRKMIKIYKLSVALIFVGILVGACSGGVPKEGEVPEIGSITFGYLPLTGYSPIYIAVDKGYFEEEGIQVELQVFKSGALMMPLLATGDLDIGGGQSGPELFNAINQDLDIRVVGPVGTQVEGHGTAPFIVRKDLFDSGQITKPENLKGATIAINVERGLSEYIIASVLELGELSLDDVTLVTMPFPDMNVAFANQAIDAAFLPQPLSGAAVRDGNAVILIEAYDLFDEPPLGILYFGKRLLEAENFEVGVRFFKAYLRACRELATEEGWTDENIEIISSYTNVPAPAIKNGVKNYWEPDGYFNQSFIKETMSYYLDQGYTEFTESLRMEQIVDLSFQEAALERIGAYGE
jgi:NitT/TauT family transport system substrate-binding protein